MLRKFSSAVLGVTMVATVLVTGAMPPSMVSAALITSDDFTSGTLANWTNVTNATIDSAIGSPAAPSMRVAPTAQAAYARINLSTPAMQACVSVNVNLATNAATGTDLFRLRTAANGAIMRVFVAANGTVQVRNDFNSSTSPTSIDLGSGWHNLELCGSIGAATSWTLYHDHVLINTVATDTGTTAIGLVQLGDTAAKTFVANFDHVVVDQAPGDETAGPPDTTAPTVPGQPSGTSPSSSTIQLRWTASTDASAPISYRIYRDGAATPVGTVTALTFTDTGLTAGSSHTYTVDAVDPTGNASAKSTASASITVQAAGTDTTPPTVPGRPTGTSPSPGTIVISWTGSTDASAPIRYRIYRDGVAAQIATVTALTFTDTALATGSSHTYTIDAIDPSGNASAKSQASAPIVIPVPAQAVIVDDFASLGGWTVTRLTLSNTIGSPTAPSARAEVTAQSASATRALPATMSQACVSVNVNLASGSGIDLFRLRTAASGALIKVLVAADGTLAIRNDLNPETHTTGVVLGAGWHNIELCGTVGAATSWTLFRDNVLINTWATNTGANPIGVVQLGYATASTYTANFDHFVVDTSPGDGAAPPPDTAPPTVPGRPTGTSSTSSTIQLSWAASTDASPPISYRVYRDGGANPVGTVAALSFTDTGLAGGSSHTYTVDAVDALGNASAKSQASATIVVQVAAPAVIIDDFANLASWTVTRLTLSTTAGSPTAPSARAQVTSQSAYGVRTLPAAMNQACVSVNVNLASGSGIDLFRLRTAANGALIKVVVAADGTLGLRNDINPATRTTTTALGTGWHNVELCGSVGAATNWTLYRDGILVNTWATNTGTTPIGLVQLGYTTASTFTANYDHFVVDTGPGDGTPPPPDTAPPTVPGRPTGTSPSSSSIQISWAASTDATPPINYRVYRDGGATPIGTVTALTFTDTALASGSSHTYAVDAVDALGHASAKSQASASIVVKSAPPAVLVDEFANLSAWTVTRLTISTTAGSPSAPSARAAVTNQSAFAVRTLPAAMNQACVSVNVNLASGSGIDLFRLRTAANGAVIKVLVAANGTLGLRNDINPQTRSTTTALGTGWHNVELCGTVGATGTWTLYRDGVLINTWTTNTGTTPIGLVQLGYTSAGTFTANFDHFVVDNAAG